MVKISGLDIPVGMEDAFFRIFQFENNVDQSVLVRKSAIPTRAKKTSWNIRSLFVLWQDLYNGLSGARKSAWTAYWTTLPYGTHAGAGGWPGSGFSAFVYANAPLYKNGLDLLLDPPGLGPELIINGGFVGNADGWDLVPELGTLVYNSNSVLASLVSVEYLGRINSADWFDIDLTTWYRISIDYKISGSSDYFGFHIILTDSNGEYMDNTYLTGDLIFDGAWHTLSFDQNLNFDAGVDPSKFIISYADDGGTTSVEFTNFSVRQIF